MLSFDHFYFTSESVTEGHPDKLADQISDAILDEIYSCDPYARVAAEVLVCTGLAIVAGQITTDCYVDIPKVTRRVINDVGYTNQKYGFDGDTCGVMVSVDEQSTDIAMGVLNPLERKQKKKIKLKEDIGAGDQGLMFGYATDETKEMMPLPIQLAHNLSRRLADMRKKNVIKYLRPDGKSQVTVEYRDGKPVRVDKVVVSTQHDDNVSWKKIRKDIIDKVILAEIPSKYIDKKTEYFVNPTGRFVIGGPQGDTGLTGRKIIVDTYGGWVRHGGGAFSGKDPTKVDRSASYAARYVAKNVVASGLANRCEVALAYAIGVAQPLAISVNTYGTGKIPEATISELVRKFFDLTPGGIIKDLQLRKIAYRPFAAYGHFGRTDVKAPWEQTDKAALLAKAGGLKK